MASHALQSQACLPLCSPSRTDKSFPRPLTILFAFPRPVAAPRHCRCPEGFPTEGFLEENPRQRRKGKVTDYGLQLKAKQKLKGYYGEITEKQFRAAYQEANRMKGDTGQNLIGLLERRLAAVVYRAKFAPTVFAARQLVSHGHVRVNGIKCNVASRRIAVGDIISLGTKAQEMALVIEAQSLPERDIPDYVVTDGASKVTFSRVPTLDEVPYPVKMEPNLVVEFYSR